MLGKKSLETSAKQHFLYSHEYRDHKMGGKKRAKQFFQEPEYNEEKCWEKNRRNKVRNNVFYIHTNIVSIIWGEKTRETIFHYTLVR